MEKRYKYLLLIIFSVLITFLTYKLSFLIAEKYFFDRLIYRKSSLYGYTKDKFPYFNKTDSVVEQRIKDLRQLGTDNKVLGTSDSHKYNIVVIGDSFTYGSGLKNEDRYSLVLEKLLNEVKPTKVFTLALPGDDFLEYFSNYKRAKEKINPDLYIVTMVDNDFLIQDIERNRELINEINSNQEEMCPGKIKYIDWDNIYLDSWEKFLSEQILPAASDEYSNSCIMKKTLARMDTQKIIFLPMHNLPKQEADFPKNVYSAEHNYPKEQALLYLYKTIVNDSGGFILNIDYSLVPDDKLRVSEKEGHFSKYTNTHIAEFLYKEITENPRWSFINSQ